MKNDTTIKIPSASNDSETVEIYQFSPKNPPRGWKAGMGTIGWKGDELYIPAGASGMSDVAALLRLAYDVVPIVQFGDALLIPEKWARRERPKNKMVYDAIRKRALEMRDSARSQ